MRFFPHIALPTLALFTLCTTTAQAANLCVDDCTLTAGFPTGGSIVATEAVTITFGSNGYINNGSSTIPYADGQTEVIAAGASLDFTSGGELDLGDGGNIDYSAMELQGGSYGITANGLDPLINIYDLTLSDGIELTLEGDVTIGSGYTLTWEAGTVGTNLVVQSSTLTNNGTLSVTGDSTLQLESSTLVNNGIISAQGNLKISGTTSLNGTASLVLIAGTIDVSGALILDLDPVTDGSCDVVSSGATLTISNTDAVTDSCSSSSLSLSFGSFSVSTVPVSSGDIQLVGTSVDLTSNMVNLNPGSITFNIASQDDLALFEGMTFPTTEGSSCTVTNGECVGNDGAKYVVNADGELELVKADDDGVLAAGWMGLLLMPLMLLMRRWQR